MIRTIVTYVLLGALFSLIFPDFLLAQPSNTTVAQQLKQARNNYYEGKFEEAQQIVLALLKNKTLNKAQQFEALVILAEIRRALNDEPGARRIIRRILEIKPDYNPTIEQEPPSFVMLVQEERQALASQQKRFFHNKKFWVLSGAATVGVVGILLLSGGKSNGTSKTLPEPPNWPTK